MFRFAYVPHGTLSCLSGKLDKASWLSLSFPRKTQGLCITQSPFYFLLEPFFEPRLIQITGSVQHMLSG